MTGMFSCRYITLMKTALHTLSASRQKRGAYAAPHFGRYNDNTYLFFSAIGNLGNGEDAGSSGIAYINITEPIKNGRFTLVSENNTEYYKLQYTSITAPTVSADGTEIPSTEETILIKPQYAVTFNGYVNITALTLTKMSVCI